MLTTIAVYCRLTDVLLKLLVFNRMFKVELEEFDEHLTEGGVQRRAPPSADTPAVCGSVPEIVELQRNAEVLALAGCDDLLQVVPLLARHAQLVALGLRGDALEPEILDEFVQALGMVGAHSMPRCPPRATAGRPFTGNLAAPAQLPSAPSSRSQKGS